MRLVVVDRPRRAWCVAAVTLMVVLWMATAAVAGPRHRQWGGDVGVGVIANTPDDAAGAVNGAFEWFVTDSVAVGPLMQLGFTGDLFQIGVSGQGKYWLSLPDDRMKLSFQGGVGFVHADFQADDTSFLIPLGAGYHFWPSDSVAIGGVFLLNITDLDTGRDDTNVMPSFTFDVRF